MFASYLSYQLLNVLLAALAVAAVLRWPRRFGAAARRLGTRFRELLFLRFPVLILGLGVLSVLNLWIQPPFGHATEALGLGVLVIEFVGLAAAFYAWLVLMPAVGLFRALRTPFSRADLLTAVLWAGLSWSIAFDALFVEPRNLVVERQDVLVAGWPEDAAPLRVVVLADLQTPLLTDRERRVVEMVEELRPDLILIPGDVLSQTFDDERALEAGRFVTTRLSAPLGVFAVNGDVDDMVEGGIEAAARGTAVRVLWNESVLVEGPCPLEIAGFDPGAPGYEKALRAPRRGTVSLALVHRPRFGQTLADHGFDLVVAGHTHGGQVQFPGIGPLITNSPLPRSVAAGGMHALDGGARLYISRGIGVEAGSAPPIRWRCPPEITVLTLGPPRGLDP